jgi:hypothetical protein
MLQCLQYFGRVLHYVVGHDKSFGVKYVLARKWFSHAHFSHMMFRIVSHGNISNIALVHFQSVANSGRRCWKFPRSPIAAQRERSAHGFHLCVCSAAHAFEIHPWKIVFHVVQIGPFFITTRFARNVSTNEVFAGPSDRLLKHTGLGNV